MTREIKPLIHFEQLEPRILLSGDSLLNIAPNPHQDTIFDNTLMVDQFVELLGAKGQVDEQINKELLQPSTPNSNVCQPIFTLFIYNDDTHEKSVDADLSIDNIDTTRPSEVLAVLSNDSDGDIEIKVGTTEDGNMPIYINGANLSIEYATSIEIRGPPARETVNSTITALRLDNNEDSEVDLSILHEYAAEVQPGEIANVPGLYLVDPTVDDFNGQVVFLDFDGEEDVTYNGPVVIENIDVPVYKAPDYLIGEEQAITSAVVDRLNNIIFADSGVTFVTTLPEVGTEYSTIYVGGDDSAFQEFGRFCGLAEKVDVSNQDRTDNAFVFSEIILPGAQTVEHYVAGLAQLIAHESGHLLGYAHDNDCEGGGPLHEHAVMGDEFRINLHTSGDQVLVSVDADAAGNYVAVWQGRFGRDTTFLVGEQMRFICSVTMPRGRPSALNFRLIPTGMVTRRIQMWR